MKKVDFPKLCNSLPEGRIGLAFAGCPVYFTLLVTVLRCFQQKNTQAFRRTWPGHYVKGWRKWSEQRSSWVAIYEFQVPFVTLVNGELW